MTYLAVPIAARDTAAALAQARAVADIAAVVEYRLDLMADFDLPALLAASPLPAIITCRASNQGGGFPGTESERRHILREAIHLAAPFVDVESEALPELANLRRGRTRLIGSLHDFAGMPGDWASAGWRLRAMGADIIKLVGTAQRADDVLPPLAWLYALDAPGIAIAMGAHGIATRLLAPRFPAAFLSFGASDRATAPGQLDVHEMAASFAFHAIADANPCFVVLTSSPIPWHLVNDYRQALAQTGSQSLLLPLPVERFTPGLLIALRLARISGVACLPDVEKDVALADFGLDPQANAWRLNTPPFPALVAALPDPNDLARFWLHPT